MKSKSLHQGKMALQSFVDNLHWIGYGFLALVSFALVVKIIRTYFGFKARSRISEARSAAMEFRSGGAQKPKVQIRQTDIVSNLDREQVKQHRIGEQLVRENRLVEASKVFESINFQRRAIDILEAAGLIDEAAEMMVRMKIPNRAAVLYERNNMIKKAAHFYAIAGMHENSAKLYLKMAHTDYRRYKTAAKQFQMAGKTLEQLKCHAHLLETMEVLEIATTSNEYEFLGQYMHLYSSSIHVFRKLSDEQIITLVESQPLTPLTLQCFAQWIQSHQSSVLARAILESVAADDFLCTSFWEMVPEQYRNWLAVQLKEVEKNREEVLERHCRAFDLLKWSEMAVLIKSWRKTSNLSSAI